MDWFNELPIELWARVLELATHVPRALDIDVHDPFDNHDALVPIITYDRRDFEASLRLKRSLSLVCRHWHHIARSLLYQVVRTGRGESLALLHRSLEEDQQKVVTENGRLTLACRIRHLDVQPGYNRIDSEGEIQASSPEELAQIADILRWAAHVEILTIAWPPYTYIPTPWLKALQSSTSSIRKLYCDGLGLPEAEWRTLIEKWVRLRTVLLTHNSAEAQISPVDLLQLPNITFFNLTSQWHGNVPKDAAIPGLKQLYLATSEDSHVEKECWEQFLVAQGRYLKTVYIAAETGTLPCMRQFAEHCPHLTHVIFVGPTLWELPLHSALPPSVTHLGLYCSTGQARDSVWSHLFYALSVIAGTDGRPLHLQAVRLLNPRLGTDFRTRYKRTKGEFIDRYLCTIHYRLEDHQGRLIELEPSHGKQQNHERQANVYLNCGRSEVVGTLIALRLSSLTNARKLQ